MQLTPPFEPVQVMVPLQPSLTAPHLPGHASAAVSGVQTGGGGTSHLFGRRRPQTSPTPEHWLHMMTEPQPSLTAPQSSAAHVVLQTIVDPPSLPPSTPPSPVETLPSPFWLPPSCWTLPPSPVLFPPSPVPFEPPLPQSQPAVVRATAMNRFANQ